jgi:protein TonB
MNRQYGLFFSVFIHVMIFLIPVSMIVKKHVQEIELFVAIEDAHEQKEPVFPKKERVKPVIEREREPEIVGEISKPVEVPVPQVKEPEIAEPVKEVIPPVPAVPAAPSPPPVLQSARIESASEPIETEFGAAVAPSFLHREMPVYPAFARKLGKEGKVVLRLTIDERGNLKNVEVLETLGYGFSESAVDAIKRSTFLPAKKDGKPVASRALLPVSFRLRRG